MNTINIYSDKIRVRQNPSPTFKSKFLSVLLLALIVLSFITSCKKDLDNYQIKDGTAPVLTMSTTNALVLTKEDSASNVLSFSWTDPKYLAEGTNGSLVGIYQLEIDVTNQFANPQLIITGNKLDTSFNVYQLNVKMSALNCVPEVATTIYFRVKSIFFEEDTLISNVCSLQVTSYNMSVPPAIAVPDELYITGAAIPAGWAVPFPDNQKFTKINETTFTLTIDLLGGKEYELVTDVTGANWTPCYRLAPDANQLELVNGGTFVWDGAGSEYNWTTKKFLTPATDGSYTLTFNFQNATFTVVSGSEPAIAVPDELYITGAAIPAGWVTPFPNDQKFTKLNETTFTLTIDLLGGKEYELVTDVNGVNWTPCYRLDPSVDPATVVNGGTFVWDGEGSDYAWSSKKFLTPAKDASYKLTFNFQNATFTVVNMDADPSIAVPDELYITGDAIPAGWATPFPADQKFTKVDESIFTLTIALKGNSNYELVADGTGANWTPCYRLAPGVNPADYVNGGSFVWDGEGSAYNWTTQKFLTPAADDTYTLSFNFQTATFTVTGSSKR